MYILLNYTIKVLELEKFKKRNNKAFQNFFKIDINCWIYINYILNINSL